MSGRSGTLFLCAIAIAIAALSLSAVALPESRAQAASYGLLVSASPDRSGPISLDGAILSGDVYAFVSPDAGASKVRFFLEDPTMVGSDVRFDQSAPFDLAGGSASRARPFDTTSLDDGPHTLTARVVHTSGGYAVVSAAFTVLNNATAPPEPDPSPTPTPTPTVGGAFGLVVSLSAGRSGPLPLGGAILSGDVYAFLSPDAGASKVRFFLDDPTMVGSDVRFDQGAPFDLVGGSASRARPFDTTSLEDGPHTLTARVVYTSGGVSVVSVAFAVLNGDKAPPEPPPEEQPDFEAPAEAVEILPGEDIQSIVDANPAGTTYVLRAGVYRLQRIAPDDGDTFLGEPGAVLNGAVVLGPFYRVGSLWAIAGQTQEGAVHGGCQRAADGTRDPICSRPEQLFLDGVTLLQVSSLGAVAPGSWFFDYDADTIYMGQDPAGHTVETSVTREAFRGTAVAVTISGLVIEKYANPARQGAIMGNRGAGWVVRNNELRLNHGTAVRTGPQMQVLDNYIHHNGQLGIGGFGNGVLVQGNEIAYNNTAGFATGGEAGGTKFVRTRDLVVRANYVHHNSGFGLWTDINNIDTLIEDNLVEWNANQGISHEISYDAVIRNNVVRYNGQAFDTSLWGSQILVQNSPNVEVYGNTVVVAAAGGDGIGVVSQNRGSGAYGPHVSTNVYVHDNDITYLGFGGRSGATICSVSANNRFDRNVYRASAEFLALKRWQWCGGMTWQDFQAAGQEAAGSVIVLDSGSGQ